MQLGITKKTTLTSYAVEQFKNQVTPIDGINHKILGSTDTIDLSGNPTMDYRVEAKTDAGVQIAPEISAGNPIMVYTLGGEMIRYRLSQTESASDIADLTLSGDKVSGLKIVGTLQ